MWLKNTPYPNRLSTIGVRGFVFLVSLIYFYPTLLTAQGEMVPVKFIVSVPVTNVRRQPISAKNDYLYDELQETQLIYNEQVTGKIINNNWVQIEANEQPEFTSNQKWQGYPGWVLITDLTSVNEYSTYNLIISTAVAPVYDSPAPPYKTILYLSCGTKVFTPENIQDRLDKKQVKPFKLVLIDGKIGYVDVKHCQIKDKLLKNPPAVLRNRIINLTKQFIDTPYLWGGRSVHSNLYGTDYATGVDCSGLTNLIYRTVGIEIPRDAQEQWMKSKPVNKPQPGDLVFLSKQELPGKIVHTMIYTGNGSVVEAPETGKTVRKITLRQRVGYKFNQLFNGIKLDGGTYLYFGSYLPAQL